jgi:hypothetical protein
MYEDFPAGGEAFHAEHNEIPDQRSQLFAYDDGFQADNVYERTAGKFVLLFTLQPSNLAIKGRYKSTSFYFS